MSKETVRDRDVRSRRRIQQILKTEGPKEAAELGGMLGVSAMAVRQHLYALEVEKLVTYELQPRPKGRPAKLWQLTEAANSLFPDAHAELTISLIDAMAESFGDDGVQKLLGIRATKQSADYSTRLVDCKNLEDRLKGLMELRTAEGYMAALEKSPEGEFLLVENHCPICAAAKSCSGLCALELSVFQEVIGDLATVERTDHILAGARRCAYRVIPAAT